MGCKPSKYEPMDNNDECTNITTVNNNSSRRIYFTNETFDTFILIWLDTQTKENNLESWRTKNLLSEITKDCLFYDNCDLFFNDIDQMKFANKKVLLIVSGSYIEIVLSKENIKEIISAVIIFCRHYNRYRHLRNNFIVDICIDYQSLKNSVIFEISSLKLNLFENQPLKSVKPFTEDTVNNGVYFKYILFIELFKKMPRTKESKETMLKKLEDYYRAQENGLNQINEFRQTYTCDKALQWYTRDGFCYRLVNFAFRTEDITLWYIFRLYITDLCIQLENIYQEQKQSAHRRLILYRGQAKISTKELSDIKSKKGGLVATTGFFSTSYNRHIAMGFVAGAPTTDDYQPVLYKIIVDTNHAKNIIFVDVFEYFSSQNETVSIITDEEREVLFNIGSVFKITDVYYESNENLWNITMEATDEGTNLIKKQIKPILEKFQIQNQNFLFGKHLLDMGYYTAAGSYFQRMLQEFSADHKDTALVYDLIGNMNMRITNWNEALRNFNHAYSLKKKKYRCTNHPDFGITLNNIGNYYKAIKNHDVALYFYQTSLKCITDSLNIARTNLNLAAILNNKKEYSQALEICHESLSLFQQIEPCPNVEIIICYGLIGDIYYSQNEYDDAEPFYTSAFEIAKKFLFIDDRHLITCIEALATTYQKQDNNNNNRSIKFCQEQLSLYKNDLWENHISIAHILMILGKISNNIEYYETALTIFERNISLDYASTANCLILLAKYYDEEKLYEKALSFYRRAYEIQKHIYPSNHPLIMESEDILNSIDKKFK